MKKIGNKQKLVGGFNPSEKYAHQIGNLPQGSGWKYQKILEFPPAVGSTLPLTSKTLAKGDQFFGGGSKNDAGSSPPGWHETFWGERGSRSKAVILQLQSSVGGGSKSSMWILCWQVEWPSPYFWSSTIPYRKQTIRIQDIEYFCMVHIGWHLSGNINTPSSMSSFDSQNKYMALAPFRCEYVHIPFSQMQFEFICKIQIRFVKAFLPVPVLGHKQLHSESFKPM